MFKNLFEFANFVICFIVDVVDKINNDCFSLKIDFVAFVTVIVDIIATTIIDIVIDKFDFVMTNMYFIFIAINTRCTTFEFEKILKVKNKRSIEYLNESCIYQKFDSYEIVKS